MRGEQSVQSWRKGIRAAACALAFSFGGLHAVGAQATIFILDKGHMDHARTVNIAGIGNVSAAPIQFDARVGGRPTSLLAWCVDVYHHIGLGDYTPDLVYTDTTPLTTDFATPTPHLLDPGDTMKIGRLAVYGQTIFDDVPVAPAPFTLNKPLRNQFPAGAAGTHAYNNALAAYNSARSAYNAAKAAYDAAVANRYRLLSAVQGAIWQVASNRNVSSSDAAFDLLVDNISGNQFSSFIPTLGHGFTLITPVQQYGGRNGRTPLPLTQSFVIGDVPEPETWALMVLGCGFAGAALRRRRAAQVS